MYRRKSRGPSTEPWGTTERTLDKALLALLKIRYVVRA